MADKNKGGRETRKPKKDKSKSAVQPPATRPSAAKATNQEGTQPKT
jgi:hypothetical protein